MAELTLRLLGSPTIEVAGRPLHVDTRKAIALLAHLAVAGPQRREALAALLWPEGDEAHARAALRRTLSVLNRELTGGWLVSERSELRLAGDGWWCDVVAFREHLRRIETMTGSPPDDPALLTELDAAATLYGGPLLAGFSLRDTTEFEAWLQPEAERLRRDAAQLLDRLAGGLTLAGRFEDAARAARRLLELDPLHEPAHRRLMLLAAWLGRRGDAVRQYRVCVATLEDELGVGPLEETTELYEAIVQGRPPPPPRSPPPAPPP